MAQLTPEYAMQVAVQLAPSGAELACLKDPALHPAVLIADLDGDRNPEIACVYWTPEGMEALIAKHAIEGWQVSCRIRGPGFGIANLAAAPIAGTYPPTLLIGWQIGERWAQLDLWQYELGSYRHLTPYDIFYSKLAIEQNPSTRRSSDGLFNLALWTHDREEAYQVELLRWQEGGIVRDMDAYPAYFSSAVVPYYARLMNEQPHKGIYRSYWEDARSKAGLAASRRQELSTDLTVLRAQRASDPALEAAIATAYNMTNEDKGSYAYNRIDLDGDGSPETVVFLSGTCFCGSGGCSAAIFRTDNGEYRLLSKLMLVQTPIIVSSSATNGYRDLVLAVSGGGVTEPVYKILKFNGVNYPSNPTVEPDLPPEMRLEGTAILADDTSLFSGIEMKI